MGGGEGCCGLPGRARPESTQPSRLFRRREYRHPHGMKTAPTLEQLRRGTPWCWVVCERCLHRRAIAFVPFIIRWGPEASSDMSADQPAAPNAAARARSYSTQAGREFTSGSSHILILRDRREDTGEPTAPSGPLLVRRVPDRLHQRQTSRRLSTRHPSGACRDGERAP
jgi:hypothetical protein